ncbi:unnamed protein product [Protopolystoma xenopodis]|uniref:Uncharacterized protein n=1 Tax=Protopolystoma xenopodis TaxID=117903 RepID=A0A448XGI9_9PLAT|nr:unnamed protein product [Protopolystoma xenopodis]
MPTTMPSGIVSISCQLSLRRQYEIRLDQVAKWDQTTVRLFKFYRSKPQYSPDQSSSPARAGFKPAVKHFDVMSAILFGRWPELIFIPRLSVVRAIWAIYFANKAPFTRPVAPPRLPTFSSVSPWQPESVSVNLAS